MSLLVVGSVAIEQRRGDREGGEFTEYLVPSDEGMVVLDVIHRIQALRAGLTATSTDMESHVLAGGNVIRVINAMIAAKKANIELPWRTATAIDLAGRDILDAVQTSVNPKVIDVPNPDLKLKPGMTANVSIEIARRANALRIPNAALRFRPTKDIFDALNQARAPAQAKTAANRVGKEISDTWITTQVQAMYFLDREVKAMQIGVAT